MNFIGVEAYKNKDGVIKKINVKRKIKEEVISSFDCEIGGIYVVNPINKLKLKNRDRKVEIIKFINNYRNTGDLRASVRFLDTNGKGFIKIDDLAVPEFGGGVSSE